MFDETPVFRKVIVPWYDTDGACILTLVFLVAVFLFACCGLSVTWELPSPYPFIWVPIALMLLSATGVTSIFLRLVRRNAYKFKK